MQKNKTHYYIRNMKYKIIIGLSAILYFTGCYNREQTPRLSEG